MTVMKGLSSYIVIIPVNKIEFIPLSHMPLFGSFDSAANKDIMSKNMGI